MVMKIMFGSFRAGIDIDLNNMREFLLELSESLTKSTEAFTKRVDAEALKIPEENRDEWYEWNADSHWQLVDVFPMILNNSLFVTIYSYVESTLFKVSKNLARKHPNSVEIDDLRGQGIELNRKYLKKVQKIDFPDTSPEWNRIKIYSKARNFIVHNDRKLDKSNNAKAVRQFVKQCPELMSIDQFDRISLTEKGNHDFIDVTHKFLSELANKIEK